ncbi:hypothetical protein ACUN7Z_18890, partial [Vreelandella venusta]|uniref:hypothetical protein n=1 Tax=Vreelandella venusta TaxID=44935 RepID=UPI004044EBE5
EVKPLSADGSVGSPHARVGHRQALIEQRTQPIGWVFCLRGRKSINQLGTFPSHHAVIPEWGDRESTLTLACSSAARSPRLIWIPAKSLRE